MTMHWCESFDLFNITQLKAGGARWGFADTHGALLTIQAARTGNGLRCANFPGGDSFSFAWRDANSNQATLICGFNANVDAAGTVADQRIFAFADLATEQISLVRNMTSGKLEVRRGATVLATSTDTLLIGVNTYIEFSATIHNTTGAFEVRFNGITQASGSGVNTRNGTNNYANRVYFGHGGTNRSASVIVDDLWLNDANGSINNGFIGDVLVKALYPDGAGANTGFTPSAGANWQCVDETPANDDTDYVSSDVPGTKDTYAFQALPGTAVVVKAVMVQGRVRKDDAGGRTMKLLNRAGVTDNESAAFAPGTTYQYFGAIHETNPDTATAWTVAEVNGAQFGIKVES